MSDIRKRTGAKGTTYQVRYPCKASATGYAYKTFSTLKEARTFREDAVSRIGAAPVSTSVCTVAQAIDKWLDVCESEGRNGRDPVTGYTLSNYQYRAEIMKRYGWTTDLHEITAPDIVAFRSWLIKNCASRDQARKVMSSFQSVVREMAQRGLVTSNVAAGVSIRKESRYDEPIQIPTENEVRDLLAAADRLANSKNKQIALTWRRYRPMLYLAIDSGMRPQEYLVVPQFNLRDQGVAVDRAIERPGDRISVTKTPAGRRFIDLSPAAYDIVKHYADHHAIDNPHDLIFPTATGHWQSVDNWRKRGFYVACEEAGLIKMVEKDEGQVEEPKFTPYALRHFYASMLIERRLNLKRIQKLMGHANIETTLNTYGHLIEQADDDKSNRFGVVGTLGANSCGESVASTT
ncbi:site-specific integrase [Pseudomonas sp. G5(2012)]|uniref:tyrosine-type recombinase/integrase n=1 Tax=Pseudomonas sp. G5(2012) TaxID=1268068 RepID=UPI00034319F0|nr:site-specific integrase [Pseudomonas sp. G5(2012)]EPA97871.1 phage integrase [Pseudomonas sp. G5(2012)]